MMYIFLIFLRVARLVTNKLVPFYICTKSVAVNVVQNGAVVDVVNKTIRPVATIPDFDSMFVGLHNPWAQGKGVVHKLARSTIQIYGGKDV